MDFTENDRNRLNKLYDCVFGNGKQGVDENMRNVLTYIERHEKFHEDEKKYRIAAKKEDRRTKTQLMIGIFIAIVTGLFQIVINYLK